MKEKIAIIGMGNMGQVIASGLLRKKIVQGKNLILCNPSLLYLSIFEKQKATLAIDNREGVKIVDVIILAVKPQILLTVLKEIKEFVKVNQLIISIAAGVEIKTIQDILGEKQSIVRVMPNLCAKSA